MQGVIKEANKYFQTAIGVMGGAGAAFTLEEGGGIARLGWPFLENTWTGEDGHFWQRGL